MSLILSGTDGLSDVDGSAATPAIRGTDANTGIFFGTDIIGFSEGGVEAMRIDSSGNVGIGTASPAVPLEVDKASGEALRVAATGANQTIHTSYIAGSPSTGNFKVGNDSATGGAFSGLGAYGVLWQAGTNLGIAFGTNNALAMSIEPSGTVILKGGSSSATGVGITFPATQSASTNANTLDDYEEGTWTPSLGGNTTYVTQQGQYTKIGRQVTVTANLSVSVLGTGSTTTISGLPFSTNATSIGSNAVGKFGNLAVNVIGLNVMALDGSVTTLRFTYISASGGANTYDPALFGNNANVTFTVTYFVN